MNRISHIGRLSLATGIGLALVLLLLSSSAPVAAATEIDLMVEVKAPTYVDMGKTYMVNVSYANKGTASAPDNWVEVTLPPGTTFDHATYASGADRPPGAIDGNVLTWYPYPLWADSTWGHIMIYLQTDETLPEGTPLTVVAEIKTSGYEPDLTNNVASVTTNMSEMGGSTKQVRTRAELAMPGDVLTYTLTVDLSNQTTGQRWVTLTDTLPSPQQVSLTLPVMPEPWSPAGR